jgi:T4 RnlA family RNA ligase
MNLEKLHRYREDGLLYSQVHPSLPLTIWNYSEKVQYEGLWDEVTLMCRGLVTDDQGNIVARPFRKFFNMEEKRHTPTQDFEVYEKMDGSLGIFFYYNSEPVFATRGSFTSDQAIKGKEILNKYNWQYGTYEGYTYLFEIIYPENRIVVDYNGLEELVVLGVIETATGKECNYNEMANEGFSLVKKYDGIKDYSVLKSIIPSNAEGFIVKFSNGDRMKIKGEEYLRLHRIMSNVSTTAVWEILSSGGDMTEILKDVPDEFYDKVNEVVKDLSIRFENIKKDYMSYFIDITNRVVSTDRKGFAEEAKRYNHPSLLFGILDGKDISPGVWKIVKPKFEKL